MPVGTETACKPKLIVLDDDPAVGRFVERIARDRGFAVDIHGCPVAFRRTDAIAGAALLLLDLDLGAIDGVEVLRDLAASGCTVPVALTSGSDDRLVATVEQIGRSYGLRMAPRLPKPIRLGQLRGLLDSAAAAEPSEARRLSTYEELHRALIGGEIDLHYQAKVDLATGRTVGCEALARWMHPTRGVVAPGEFIPIAESTGLIVPLTRHVLRLAVRQAALWRSAARSGWDPTVAVNVPADMLTDLELPDRIRALLREHDVPGSALSIEVTESEVARDLLNAMDVLARLRLMGVGLSVDDFGTGHSSLVKLRDLPFNEVKIDRTFIAGIETEEHTRALTQAAIRLGHCLGMRVVAEGVETRRTAAWLRRNGCDVAQGYLYARPVPASAFAPVTVPRRSGARKSRVVQPETAAAAPAARPMAARA
ncbi:MAG: EAL domain-containing protein [Alphaproteobacteria bacterium]